MGKFAHGPKSYIDVLITITLLVAFKSFQNKIFRFLELVYHTSLLIREVLKRLALVNHFKLTKNYYHWRTSCFVSSHGPYQIVFLFVYSFQIDTLIWMVMRQATRYSTLFLRNILLYVVIQQIASFLFFAHHSFLRSWLTFFVWRELRILWCFSHSAK